jgi:hypothetical protein
MDKKHLSESDICDKFIRPANTEDAVVRNFRITLALLSSWRKLTLVIDRLQRKQKNKRQVLLTTHSGALLSNQGIDEAGVVSLEMGAQGTTGRVVNAEEQQAVHAGLSVAKVVLPKARPSAVSQLGLWQ